MIPRSRIKAQIALMEAERRLLKALEALEGPLTRATFTFQRCSDGTVRVLRQIKGPLTKV